MKPTLKKLTLVLAAIALSGCASVETGLEGAASLIDNTSKVNATEDPAKLAKLCPQRPEFQSRVDDVGDGISNVATTAEIFAGPLASLFVPIATAAATPVVVGAAVVGGTADALLTVGGMLVNNAANANANEKCDKYLNLANTDE